MGYTVTRHPEVDGTNHRPDFRAEKDGGAVYVEARSASSSNVAVGADAKVNTLYESLDKLDSPNFFLWINVERQGGGPLRARPLRSTPAWWIDDWAGEVLFHANHRVTPLPRTTTCSRVTGNSTSPRSSQLPSFQVDRGCGK
ncbi:hypothetical protein [Nonomuraea pusilla]|uniref:hypothetical protein n=1 Tax=Nonomuraea pusilla TaxID=46177 RepID=UPI000AA0D015|nr:hypothetical protein [Nonomuraea pusilla]